MDAEAALLLLWAAADITNDTNTDADDDNLLTDVGGYLACGCHGSQPEHTCGPLD